MDDKYLISDAARMVQVESHVLRYWEEELGLPIQRNELGHRFYTQEDVERFRKIKNLKGRGLQLRAIKMILKGGNLDAMGEGTLISHLMFHEQEEKDAGLTIVRQEDHSEVTRGSQQENTFEVVCSSREKVSEATDGSQEDHHLGVMAGSLVDQSSKMVMESRGEGDYRVMNERREDGLETKCEESVGYTGGMAIEILEVRDLEKEWAEAHRGEEYFKKLDQILRDKCTSDKKKRHFIF